MFSNLVLTKDLPTDERFFTHANQFIPERWTTKPELTKDPSLFAPFSIGNINTPATLT